MGRCILSRMHRKHSILGSRIYLLIGQQKADGNGHGTHVA